ncbi:MAG TPA: hypothetical protein PKY77_07675 [Phycisphaerae bacterium]|nr:hypothetical protein [Phycisphaerae bacterium]HRY67880.1 hypothetical protein [Phycisphaerae bacterium]HSA25334.1 hypothetical protein [Phycisphaerae bacterium]
MKFRELTQDDAVNEQKNVHVVCSRRGNGCYMPNQVINNTMTDEEREQSVAALNRVGWRIGEDGRVYCPSCVLAIGAN